MELALYYIEDRLHKMEESIFIYIFSNCAIFEYILKML